MIIGIDFDDVIATTIHLKHKMAKELFGVDGIPSHRFKEGMVVGDGLMTKEQYRKLMNTICGDKVIGLEAAPIEGGDVYIPKLKADGHRLVVITSREGSELEVVKEWCKRREYQFEYVSVGYGKDKKETTKGVDVYVDDDFSKLMPLIGQVPHLFLFTQPHNFDYQMPDEIRRVDNWDELYDSIQKI